MQLVFSAETCASLRLPEMLALATEAGFSRVELFRQRTESAPVHPDFSVPMVRDHIRRAGFELAAYHIRDLTGRKADSDERNLGYNLRQLEWDIHLGRALGIRAMSTRGGARTDEALEDLIAGARQLLENIPDIALNLGSAPENRLQGLEDFRAVLPQLPERARLLLDTGALLEAGEDPLALAGEFSTRLGLVRLADRRQGQSAPLGEGDLPLEDLLTLLGEAEYQGDLVLAVDADPAGARQRTQELLARATA